MVLFPPCWLLLQALCLIPVTGRLTREAGLSFLVPTALSQPYQCNTALSSRQGIAKKALKRQLLFASTTPLSTKRVPEWERALLETWKEHGETILLGTIYGIRIFRFLLHIRNLLEWLPQANPYLFPFDTIYQATNAYLKFFQTVVPPLYGVDVSGIVAAFVLDHIESLLAHKPVVAQEALK